MAWVSTQIGRRRTADENQAHAREATISRLEQITDRQLEEAANLSPEARARVEALRTQIDLQSRRAG